MDIHQKQVQNDKTLCELVEMSTLVEETDDTVYREFDVTKLQQLITQKQLEDRIKELEMMQGGDVEFQRYSEWRIAELKAQAKE